MRSLLVVTDAASDLALLTIEELRDAIGDDDEVADDFDLSAIGLRAAAAIMSECGIASGSGYPPTLMRETLTETFRRVWNSEFLILSRRHDVDITSIVVDGTTLDEAEYEVDPGGTVTRLSSDDCPIAWCGTKIVVVYEAGFTTAPGDLKQAAIEYVKANWVRDGRDPSLRSEVIDVPGVERTEKTWWVGSVPGQSFGAVPDSAKGYLTRFRNFSV